LAPAIWVKCTRDPRLVRDVAIKVLPTLFSSDAQRLRRFEQEARATAALNHPNILAVYDIGQHEGAPYIVSEVLSGETLREKLRTGPVPVRKAVDYALQTCRGLAAAHDKGIVHRDLKPDNIFVSRDGQVKILDFGLAKLAQPEFGANDPTRTIESDVGSVVGTLGYMSPEQVRGKPVDARSDLFALGAVLYELLSGHRAFNGETPADTISAILHEDPPELSSTDHNVPPGLERIVRHSLEKDPEERFQSARDVAFSLESATAISTPIATSEAAPKRRWRTALVLTGLTILVAAAALVGWRWKQSLAGQPEFRRLTFRRGTIRMARFTPDGQTIIYGAAWDGNPVELFRVTASSSDSSPFGIGAAQVLGISKTGELALQLNSSVRSFVQTGTLGRMPLNGGAPRQVLDNVQFADWSADGHDLAVVRYAPATGLSWVEYPVGNVIYKGPAWIGHLRLSPDGSLLAFAEHFDAGDDGRLTIIDRKGNKKLESRLFESFQGLAWRPDGNEVWFTAAITGGARALYAVNMRGMQRLVLRVPGALVLQDISNSGSVLLTNDNARKQTFALAAGEGKERNLSWFDWTALSTLSEDGKVILFSETGEASPGRGLYLRRLDGSAPVRVADGNFSDLSPDGKWVVASDFKGPPQFVLFPTGIGQPRQITHDNLIHLYPHFTPDAKAIVFIGRAPQAGLRTYYQPIEGGGPVAITPEGVAGSGASHASEITISPDGAYIIAPDSSHGSYAIYPVHGSQPPRPVKGVDMAEAVVSWSADGKYLFTYHRGEAAPKIFRVEIATGKRLFFKQTSPPDVAGVEDVTGMRITADGRAYAYSCNTVLSDLYVVQGLR
jgi:Tol biopolymer transport system component